MDFTARILSIFKRTTQNTEAIRILKERQERIRKEAAYLRRLNDRHQKGSAEIILLGNGEYLEVRYCVELIKECDNEFLSIEKRINRYRILLTRDTFYKLIVDIRKAFRTRMNFIFKNLDDAHVGVEFFPVYKIQQTHLTHYLTWKHRLKRQYAL